MDTNMTCTTFPSASKVTRLCITLHTPATNMASNTLSKSPEHTRLQITSDIQGGYISAAIVIINTVANTTVLARVHSD